MTYLILMAEENHFANWDRVDESQRQRVYADFAAFDAAVKERGSILGGEALTDPATARTVRPSTRTADPRQPDPDRPVTQGPYAETVEQLGGFYLIDVPSMADAVELAKLLPREYLLEVREVLDVEID